MPRLTPKTTLNSLRKDAKRWLKDLRSGDAAARQRFDALNPNARPELGLRDVQHALARDYGFEGWAQLKQELANRALGLLSRREQVDIILHHVWQGDLAAASRLALHHPEIARENIFTAILFGDLAAVKDLLAEDPAAASRKGGVMDWEPILYLAYGRLPVPAFVDNSLALLDLLIDHGADPNVFFDDGWENPFKVLTGVIGLGEGVRPPHPLDKDMARRLIERGADPFDTQALYNASIVGDDTYWLDFLYGYCERQGTTGRWKDVHHGLGGKKRMAAIDYLLGNAVTFNHPRRTEWLLTHGADPNGVNAYSLKPHHEEALLLGFNEVADLLLRHGATPAKLDGQGEFRVAALNMDAEKARDLAARHPAYLRNAATMAAAIFAGRADVVALLLDLGMDVNLPDANGALPIHVAAQVNSVEIGKLLVDRGADIDFHEPKYGGTALGWANQLKSPDMVDFLVPLSRDIYEMVNLDRMDRVKALLDEEPGLVNTLRQTHPLVPLHCLPDDEDRAAEIAEFLMARGADTTIRSERGLTPEQAARKRGLEDAADIIRDAAG